MGIIRHPIKRKIKLNPFNYFIITLLFTLNACAQKEQQDRREYIRNAYKFINATDIYRANVADSLKHLIPILDSIFESDQEYRYGSVNNPKGKIEEQKILAQFQDHKKKVHIIDSINVLKVSSIIDKYGWLGYKRIGIEENNALFFVIQHADSATQEKYLPSIKEAVLNKLERPHHLALLEDRLSIKKNKYQVYGTQVFYNPQTKKYHLYPILNPDQIIEKRSSIGLDSNSFQLYLNSFNIIWNINTYQKELPEIQKFLSQEKFRFK